jgi:hypothetical protein
MLKTGGLLEGVAAGGGSDKLGFGAGVFSAVERADGVNGALGQAVLVKTEE